MQASDETPKPPQPETARKLPQYGLRNTVDLGGAAQQLAERERNQRSWSAPPESRAMEEQPKRFVSRIEIQPSAPKAPGEVSGSPAATNPGVQMPSSSAGNSSANPGKPPVAPKQQTKSGERLIPIFVEGRSEPVFPKESHERPQQSPPQPPPQFEQQQHPFPERSANFDDYTDFPQFKSRGFNESAFADRFARPDFANRNQRHFGEPFWAHRGSGSAHQPQHPQQPPPSPPQKRPMPAQSPPTKRTQEQAPAAENAAPPPPPPPVNDPLSKVAAVQKDVDALMREIEEFSGQSKSDKQYIFLDEMLTRNLIKLDDIDTNGKDEIRKVRKEAIRSIQRAISLLESKVKKTEERSINSVTLPRIHAQPSFALIFLETVWLKGIAAVTIVGGETKNPEIVLSHDGKISGTTMKSLDGREFYAFRGIPYAKPPVGDLRFRAPEPVEPWKGVRDATKESEPCAQVPVMGDEKFIGSEDCLYLNVYTPQLPSEEVESLPVIFWIHGGAFYAGDGGIEENGPEFLMDQNIVLVTINYRLGAFGFLSSGNQKIQGNFGMKDQVLALKWVQENIEFFNGDKSKVTLWGYSAGGAAVEAHLFSPMSSGLFSGAIYQSGTLKSECALKSKPVMSLPVLGSIVNCNQIKVEDQLKCLRATPASDLAKAINKFPYWGLKVPAAFSIVQEIPNHLDGSWTEEPFLTVNPNKMLEEGSIVNDVPTITGIAKDEGIILGYELQRNPSLYAQANRNFNDVARLCGCLFELKPKKFKKIKEFYFGEERINEKQFDNFLKFQSDAVWNWPQVDTAFKQAKASKSPVYFYLFSFEGRISEAMAAGLKPIEGVGHADDLAYMLRRRVPFPDDAPNEREKNTIKRMGSILESFARTGNPNPTDNELFTVEWEPIDPKNFRYLNIDEDLEMKEDYPFSYRMDFWQQLTKKKSKPKKETKEIKEKDEL
ncbi:Hypothetical predicted protein [Cloeon dipterum]|uniref:BAG domain-containing protein n=1 Tax=Cloeon dipterum TaxID=197152 RepID=A0A8S1CYM0_9INSE|nr:Hypothetical predicted protein [Cloeon dipterum]